MRTRFKNLTLLTLPLAIGCGTGGPANDQVGRAAIPILSDDNLKLDLEATGPYSVETANYNLGDAVVDPLVSNNHNGLDAATDVRGALYLPRGNGHFQDGHFPLLVFLHGNHASCRTLNPSGPPYRDSSSEYTLDGSCTDGRVEAPSYLGYDYLARHMASHGYASISINANRGIAMVTGGLGDPDGALILTRGRLVLKHLAKLYAASREDAELDPKWGLDVRGKVDFGHVGMMGHSRGGEGVRAALHLYKVQDNDSYASQIPGLSVQGVFEFAPLDLSVYEAPYSPQLVPLDAEGAHWTVVVGSCDQDVSDFRGVGPFSRRRAEIASGQELFSSVFAIPGANHNYFNTEWMIVEGGENAACPTDYTYLWDPAWAPDKVSTTAGSERQQRLGIMTLSAFFRGFVGEYPGRHAYQKLFDPQYRLPEQLTNLPVPDASVAPATPVRESLWHDLTEVATQLDSSSGSVGTSYRETVLYLPKSGFERRLTQITWSTSSTANYYDAHLWADGRVLDGSWILSPSVARYQDAAGDPLQNNSLDVNVRLLYSDGTQSASVNLTTYVTLTNRVNEVPTCSQQGGDPEGSDQCRMHDATRGYCEGTFEAYPDNPRYGDCILPLQSKFLLFHEVPIELEDFDTGDRSVFTKPVKGLRFTFDGTLQGKIFLDHAFILRAPFKGDVNANGKADILDALATARFFEGKPVLPFNRRAADVDCNGTVDMNDALLISSYSTGLISEFPCSH